MGFRDLWCWLSGAPVELCELVLGAGEADLESFDLAEPALAFGFGDAGDQVVADLEQAVPLGGVGPEEWASDAGVLVNATAAEGPSAGADGDFAAFEMAQEFLPFLVGGCPVFVGGTQVAAAGQERQMRLDGLVGVDGFVAHGDVDVAVPGDDLGDVGRQPVEDGVGDEEPSEVVGVKRSGWPVAGSVSPVAAMASSSMERIAEALMGAVLAADAALEQQRQWWQPDAFVVVVGGDERDGAVGAADAADDGAENLGELGADHQEPFGVGLRWCDLQQRHDFAGGGQPVLNQAVV